MSLDFSLTVTQPVEVFSSNITHNLGKMASAAGLYKVLWRPEEIGVEFGWQAVPHIVAGLRVLEAAPFHFRQFDDPGGWGSYDNLVSFTRQCLQACLDHPDGIVGSCR